MAESCIRDVRDNPRKKTGPMINTQHLLKATAAWVSIVYVVCFGGVALYPQIRELFMRYALHVEVDIGSIITPLTFIAGDFMEHRRDLGGMAIRCSIQQDKTIARAAIMEWLRCVASRSQCFIPLCRGA